MSLLALFLALVFSLFLLPVINQLTQKHLSLFNSSNLVLLAGAVSTAVLLGIVAGLYPALYLSSFKPVLVLKGLKSSGKSVFSLRKALVIFQFMISVAMIAGTLIVIQQIDFIQNAKLGLNKEQVMIIEGAGNLPSRSSLDGFKNDLLQIPAVKKVAGADGVIGGQNWANSMRAKGSQNSQLVNFLSVGPDFIDVMGMELKEGRSFSDQFPADTIQDGIRGTLERESGGIILNETAIKQLGVPKPAIGQKVIWAEDEDTTYNLTVVGVVKDFHFTSLRNEIKPFAFVLEPDRQSLLTLKLQTGDLGSTISMIEKKWNQYSPNRPFQYSFLDETFGRLYQSEVRFRRVFIYITTIALIIACLGLFGLAAFVTEQRTREIGIRKVLGASVQGLISLLSKDFLKLVGMAIIIAVPISWYFMNKWLQDFAYRINVSWWIFAVAGVIAMMIALLTVSVHAIKAAVNNPVKSLRTE